MKNHRKIPEEANFFDVKAPIFTDPRFLPPSRIDGGRIEGSLVSDGCVLAQAEVRKSLLEVRSRVGTGSQINRTVVMGADFFETEESVRTNTAAGLPLVGVGRNTRIENAIIDKNARIGDNCVIAPGDKPGEADHDLYSIRDGIVIIPKNGIVPNGTVI